MGDVEKKYPPTRTYLSCLRPKNLTPQKEVHSLNDITTEELRARGIKGIIFDVDNTLCHYCGTQVDRSIAAAYARLISEFNACIVSNSNEERVRTLSSCFGIHTIDTPVRKPLPEPFLEAAAYLQATPAQIAVIGDRLLTDIGGGNRVGMFTIKVDPLHPRSEPATHHVVRMLETFVLEFYRG